jgi:hypothetical protein
MANLDVKQNIIASLGAFTSGSLSANALNLFSTLGYNTDRQAPLDKPNYANFKETFFILQSKFNEDKALVKDWQYVDLLFQLSKEEIRKQISLFDTQKVDRTIIETYLFFAIALSKDQYSRTELSNITREVNRLFPMPVMILFKHGQYLTLAVINRRQHKRDENKDVLEKITLIKDIKIETPHRAHIEILFDLSFDELQRKNSFTNFVELHNAWQKTLDTKELNKRFYSELSNWYFWAMDYVSFPDDVEKDKDVRNATNLIRLITRIIFIWFIKEKSLVPDVLFDRREMARVLKAFEKNNKSDSYYRAILQNLFFGTLNQQMNERGFARDGSFLENKNNYGVKNLFRYAGDFAIGEKEVLSLFKDIPFLNGGLFDCLDKENDEDKVVYGDGFSRNPKKQATVPDNLFFGEEIEYDLNAIYGTKNKRYKVKGLFNILSAYKFTVAENTPVEEEIALDPELLGRVFENLLASYNPETQTTARKQTGSFYTPREIVNYMVDESLKAYLQQKLEDETGIQPEDAEAGLEILFTYTEKEHAFTERETKALITAIDNCKILDPACGSGAFPMGVLHKLVHILHKLDPQNEKWQERQIYRARQLDDPAIREKTIENIESAFANNELDYGRKLYLIENCIYGVDIQPIAVQIAKLRFFISLVVDQKKNPGRKNLGILSLPNLETKFVAANTLIGLDKPQTGGQISFKNPEIEKLEEELKALRHQYFNARTRKEKLACQKKDRDLRRKISALLEKDGWAKDSASQVSSFDPYDQNASSPFFDPEWMFGLSHGFSILIGNPPYFIVKASNTPKDVLQKYVKYYSADFKVNLFALFLERALILSEKKGTNSFIIPDSSLNLPAFKKLREYILKNAGLKFISHYNEAVFESGEVGKSVILQYNKAEKYNSYYFRSFHTAETYSESKVELEKILKDTELKFVYKSSESKSDELLDILKSIKTKLSFYCEIYDGINPGSEEIKETIITKKKIDKDSKKIIDGKCFNKYTPINWDGDYIYYNEDFVEKLRRKIEAKGASFTARIIKKSNFFKYPKIVTRQTADTIIGTFDLQSYYVKNSVHSTLLKSQFGNKCDLKTILTIINSKLIEWYYKTESLEFGRIFPQVKIERLRNLPIVYPANSQFTIICEYLLFLNKQDKASFITTLFTRLLDVMVYELYLPKAIQKDGCEILKHLNDLPELKEDWSDEKKLRTIEKVYEELSNPKHPVSIAMFKMDTVEEIRIIEGKQ